MDKDNQTNSCVENFRRGMSQYNNSTTSYVGDNKIPSACMAHTINGIARTIHVAGCNCSLPKPSRPTKDQYYMNKALLASTNSTCKKLRVGAVLVKKNADDQLYDVATGYNGSLPGHEHCTDVGCLIHNGSCKRTVHAEMNVIDRCARFGIATEGAIIYTTHYPCPDCMLHISNCGIKEVVFLNDFTHKYENQFHLGLHIRRLSHNNLLNIEEM